MQKSRNPERDIFEAFKVYDTKKQGVISMKDLKHVMMRTGEKLSQQDCKCFPLEICFVILIFFFFRFGSHTSKNFNKVNFIVSIFK